MQVSRAPRGKHLTGHLTLAAGYIWDRTPVLDIVRYSQFLTSVTVEDVDTTVCSMSEFDHNLWYDDEPNIFSIWPQTGFLRKVTLDYTRLEPREYQCEWMSDHRLAMTPPIPSVTELLVRFGDKPSVSTDVVHRIFSNAGNVMFEHAHDLNGMHMYEPPAAQNYNTQEDPIPLGGILDEAGDSIPTGHFDFGNVVPPPGLDMMNQQWVEEAFKDVPPWHTGNGRRKKFTGRVRRAMKRVLMDRVEVDGPIQWPT